MRKNNNQKTLPWGFGWRSSKHFILIVVVISLFLDLFLYGLIVPILPFILKDRIHLPQDRLQSAASLLLASHAVATFLTAPLIGIYIDGSMSRRHGFLLGLIVTLFATTFLCFGRTLWQLAVARWLQGASAAIVWIVGLTIVTDTVLPEHLGQALGTVYSATTFGALMSPTIGGLVYTKFGYYPVYFIAGMLLSIDIVLRLLVIDKEAACRLVGSITGGSYTSPIITDERTHLLEPPEDAHSEEYSHQRLIHDQTNNGSKPSSLQMDSRRHHFPIIQLMTDPRLLAASFVTFTHACLVGMFNATLPIHVQKKFGMSSLESGLLFTAIELPYIFCGPPIGWYVDYAGPRGPASMGALLLVPSLFFLRYPKTMADLPLLVILLALNGIGLSATSSSAFIQANKIGRARHLENPVLFGSKGPYGQLYALNNILYSLGMTVGPLLSGTLTDHLGYGNAMTVMCLQALLAAVISWLWMEK